jgi:polysaccharide biosynthesis protein PslH
MPTDASTLSGPKRPSTDQPSGTRRAALYVTPVMPQRHGNGLAMRAGLHLQALAECHDVHLFVVPVAGSPADSPLFASRHAVRIGGLDLARHVDPHAALIARVLDPGERARAAAAFPRPWLSRFCISASARCLAEWCGAAPLAAVHVMRLYLAPLAEPFLRQGARETLRVLDLDDDEMRTHERLARLHGGCGDAAMASQLEAEACKYQSLATRLLARFDRVLVCSASDAARLAGRFPGASFAVVPNGYPLPGPVPVRPRRPDGPIRLLFVGTLGYQPNADAVRFLCDAIVPEVRRAGGPDVRVDVVGGGAGRALQALAADPAIVLHGAVTDLAPLYGAADIAVVPIRAGGGTRIKILEAFAHGVPVVSTRLGAEGIAATDGVHLLLADDAQAFAAACLRLKRDPDEAAALARRAGGLVEASHGAAAITAALAAAYRM